MSSPYGFEIHGGKNGNKILIGVCYKPPNITESMESLLLKQIDEAATHNEVLVMGDFNYPDINWETETCETHKGNRFLLITKKNYLSQLVQNPTRGAALLDLILSNRPDRITNLQVVGHLGNSDHNIVQFHLSFTRGTCQGVTKTLNFRKAKFDQLRDALNLVDWDNILRNKNTDNKWEMFKKILNRQCKRFIPCGNKRTRNRKNPMWLNKEVRQAINSKKKAFALLKQDGTIEALINYREKNTLSKKLIKAAKKETEKHIAKESKTNPKLFFNYINSKRIKTENVGPLKNSEERMVVDDEEKANILNTFFSTVFTVENEMLGEIPRNNENPILRVTNLTQEEVRNRLNKIKIDKSPGPDGIHPRVLRELTTGSVPQDWRIANVVPIFKKGSKSEPGNYRPMKKCFVRFFPAVTQTAPPFKGTAVVNGEFKELSLEKYKGKYLVLFFYPLDFTFVCPTEIVAFSDKANEFHDVNCEVVAVSVDSHFCHLAWTNTPRKYFALNRTDQCAGSRSVKTRRGRHLMKIGGAVPDRDAHRTGPQQDRPSDLRQGQRFTFQQDNDPKHIAKAALEWCKGKRVNVLEWPSHSPDLNPMKNLWPDVKIAVHQRKSIFADDTKLCKAVNTREDSILLQMDLDKLETWAERWQMRFNNDKCKVIHMGRGNQYHHYTLNGKPLGKSDREKDLGILVNDKLTWSSQCQAAAAKANRIMGCIKRGLDTHDESIILPLYKSLSGGLGHMNIALLSDLSKQISRDYGVLLETAGIALSYQDLGPVYTIKLFPSFVEIGFPKVPGFDISPIECLIENDIEACHVMKYGLSFWIKYKIVLFLLFCNPHAEAIHYQNQASDEEAGGQERMQEDPGTPSFMHDIFREYLDKFIIVYLDDVLFFSDDWESHVQHVRKVFQVLRANSLFVKGSKCLFGVQKISFLGYIFSPSTIEMDPVKVQAICDWTQPKSLKSLQKFLGFANFYRRFITNFSSVVKPLTDLTKKGADVTDWSPAAVEAFQELKRRFSSAPVLRQPDTSFPFQVEVDASEIGAGAVLSQRSSDGSVMKPCAFFSRKFSPAERNYVGNRELLAMKWAFEEWRHWLEGARHRVVVLTDHKNLMYLESAKRLNPRQARWSLFFSRFNFVVSYLPGSKNVKADALSRSFVLDSPGNSEPTGILRDGVILSAVSPDLRRALQEFQADKPDRCPPERLFVPDNWTSRVISEVEPSDCPGVDMVVDRLHRIWSHVVDNLKLSQGRAQQFANRRRRVGPRLLVGDLVWLSSRFVPMKVSSPKFKPRFIGPYRILEILNPVSFRLDLPASFAIHNVFHRSLLRKYEVPVVPSLEPPAPVLVEGELEYVVEKILDSRVSRRKLQYLVKWKGYGQEDNSWVIASDVHAADLVRAFHRAHPGGSREGSVTPPQGGVLLGLFIIDPNGIVRHMSVNDLPVGRSVEETLRLVKAFQGLENVKEVKQCLRKPPEFGNVEGGAAEIRLRALGMWRGERQRSASELWELWRKEMQRSASELWECGGGRCRDPPPRSGNVEGGDAEIRLRALGMWRGKPQRFASEIWECGGGRCRDPPPRSGNVEGGDAEIRLRALGMWRGEMQRSASELWELWRKEMQRSASELWECGGGSRRDPPPSSGNVEGGDAEIRLRALGMWRGEPRRSASELWELWRKEMQRSASELWECGGGSRRDPPPSSGNVEGEAAEIRLRALGMWRGRDAEIRLRALGMWRGEPQRSASELWECGGGSRRDPPPSSGNVEGGAAEIRLRALGIVEEGDAEIRLRALGIVEEGDAEIRLRALGIVEEGAAEIRLRALGM
ncbi:unnamed protein product [Ranitomeya imitator]|uniref:ribonuclease H n=1 Tax=Ranitomeya imitator TaxID=111125 RepID=A0ABN9MME2_9NEOB|nr:unnamed protein product [Ranitomeya imitator]